MILSTSLDNKELKGIQIMKILCYSSKDYDKKYNEKNKDKIYEYNQSSKDKKK